ncbi:unnamed protein product [Auanema sp. JU1783]|nr:unnamed protein product [Auanema sp. JU1783]
MQVEMPQCVAHQEDQEKTLRQHTNKKPINRPAMQIYRPPGLRSGGGDTSTVSSNGGSPTTNTITKPTKEAGSKPLHNSNSNFKEENNNIRNGNTPVEQQQQNSRASSRSSNEERRLNRTESSLSSESALSQRSVGSSGNNKSIPKAASITKEATERSLEKKLKQLTPPKKEPKKKILSEKEMPEIAKLLRQLHLVSNTAELEQWIEGCFQSDELAEIVGSSLCQHAIEGGGGRGVAKICGSLKDSASIKGLSRGLLTSISQYLDCRDKLRTDHFRMWISFLTFVSDLYANIGAVDVFDYLLRSPILETLKIEELECLISTLLSVGYDLERECPDQLALLKDLIRDAFITVSEPWARKMILLLLELGASGWKLPAEANEYYFQQT